MEGDGLPNQVCLQCVYYINRAFSFKQLCERSDSTLRQLLGRPIDTTFLELKPVSVNEYVVTNEVENIPNEISELVSEEKSLGDDDFKLKYEKYDNDDGFGMYYAYCHTQTVLFHTVKNIIFNISIKVNILY